MPDWPTVWALLAIAVVPVTDLGKIFTAALAKKVGLSPKDIHRYQQATDEEGGDG